MTANIRFAYDDPQMLTLTKKGLYCAAGRFYIDPNSAVEHAVITHAHSDHARRGSEKYYCARQGKGLLHGRLGQSIIVESYDYGESFIINGVKISFHSAGHILGSAQVRLELDGEIWVVSGDYKREPDPTCAPFENVACDVFVTEATFGTPAYQWPKNRNTAQEIFDWWNENANSGFNSVLFAYSLGKTQRILGSLSPLVRANAPAGKIYCHSAATPLNNCYLAEGVDLAPAQCLSSVDLSNRVKGGLFIVPSAFLKTESAKDLLGEYKTAFASGWMAENHSDNGFNRQFENRFDRGFIMSDHSDWNDLVQTVQESKAKTVYVQHRGHGALVKHLRSLGFQAFPDSALIPKNPDQMALF